MQASNLQPELETARNSKPALIFELENGSKLRFVDLEIQIDQDLESKVQTNSITTREAP